MVSTTRRTSPWRGPALAVTLLASGVAAAVEWFFAGFSCHFGDSPHDEPYTGRDRLCHAAGSVAVHSVLVLWLVLAVAAVGLQMRWARGRGHGVPVLLAVVASAVLPLVLAYEVSPRG